MQEDDIMPEGVKLRDFEDTDTLRNDIFSRVHKQMVESFPRTQGGVTLELNNLDYDNTDPVSVKNQKDAILKGKYLY